MQKKLKLLDKVENLEEGLLYVLDSIKRMELGLKYKWSKPYRFNPKVSNAIRISYNDHDDH